jgi:hypothetical protein
VSGDMAGALLAALRGDGAVQAVFGSPARLYDDESEAPAFPFARLERHEMRTLPAAGGDTAEDILTLSVSSRHGGLREAKACLDTLREAFGRVEWSVPGRSIGLAYTLYADVMRQSDRRAFRGVIRFRIFSEEAG